MNRDRNAVTCRADALLRPGSRSSQSRPMMCSRARGTSSRRTSKASMRRSRPSLEEKRPKSTSVGTNLREGQAANLLVSTPLSIRRRRRYVIFRKRASSLALQANTRRYYRQGRECERCEEHCFESREFGEGSTDVDSTSGLRCSRRVAARKSQKNRRHARARCRKARCKRGLLARSDSGKTQRTRCGEPARPRRCRWPEHDRVKVLRNKRLRVTTSALTPSMRCCLASERTKFSRPPFPGLNWPTTWTTRTEMILRPACQHWRPAA